MRFESPELLPLLALVPIALIVRWLAVRRRARNARSRAIVTGAVGADGAFVVGRRSRAFAPLVLFTVALAALLFAVARPSAVLTLPAPHDTVILAIDISGSMRADDLAPDRISAARAAALDFIDRQPSRTRVGVVAFAATAALVQPPTHDRNAVLAAIDRLQLQQATAIGSGLLVSLKAIEPGLNFDLYAPDPRAGTAIWPEPRAPGSNRSAAIVLVSDGQSVTGPDPLEAARIVAERGVRVHVVGLGTPKGTVLGVQGWSMRVKLDETTLREIADITHGHYYSAEDAADLRKVYRSLGLRVAFERQRFEVTGVFALAGALLLVVSAGLSMWRHRRVF